MTNLSKIVIVLGPTASGKTDLAIALAKKFNGEIISADSRQIYKQMNIATAKPQGRRRGGAYVVEGVPHYLMDIVKPDENFTLADFKEQAIARIYDILERKKLPIIAGGTGLYIWSVAENLDIPRVAPNPKLRTELESKTPAELVEMLKKLDPASADKIDLKNQRRVLRALEVAVASGESFFMQRKRMQPIFDVLEIGINLPREDLYKRIEARVDRQIKDGLVAETKKLAKKYSWNLPSMSGIGYKQVGSYLRGEITLPEAVERIKIDTRHYAKRQITWFKRDKGIIWVSHRRVFSEACRRVRQFLRPPAIY